MFYLADFEYKAPFLDNIIEDTDRGRNLRERVLNKNKAPKSLREKKLRKRIKTNIKAAKYIRENKPYSIYPKRYSKDDISRLNYLTSKQYILGDRLDKATIALQKFRKNKDSRKAFITIKRKAVEIDNKLKNTANELENTQQINRGNSTQKVINTLNSESKETPKTIINRGGQQAPKVVTTNTPSQPVSKVSEKVKEVVTKSPTKKATIGLGKKALLGTAGLAGLGALAIGVNKLRKSRADKGKLRGKYKK
jgi:hypothetical protein